ncbi:hypothetical protein [Bacillus cereus group sp. BfR-BA-01430]|uniref:hypothetical protein n=1 Tax=Bacillus cereus group sp. BfR-BA-01430 TaxID=2920346 RepID=UPI001F5A6173|nr:hypothetical protein [Bacillus cereus group sp. BfR-BA-01430]
MDKLDFKFVVAVKGFAVYGNPKDIHNYLLNELNIDPTLLYEHQWISGSNEQQAREKFKELKFVVAQNK